MRNDHNSKTGCFALELQLSVATSNTFIKFSLLEYNLTVRNVNVNGGVTTFAH